MKHYLFLLLSTTILLSCGKSIDKNTLEGRVASFISLQEGVYMAVSMDLKNIIDKSGIRDGTIPDQYLSVITPYLDALTESINMDKQVYMMPNINTANIDNSGFVLMFEIKNVDRFKKEIKEFGVKLKKKGDLEYGFKSDGAFGVYKGETGFVVFSEYGQKIDEALILAYGKNMGKGKTIAGVVDFVTQKSDIVAFYTGEKMSNFNLGDMAPEMKDLSTKMNTLYEGTFWIAKVDFKDQEAVLEVDFTIGKNLKKYAPFLNTSLSDESKSIVVSEKTLMAFAINANMDNLMSMIFDQLDDKTKDELNKQLSMLGGTEKFKKLFSGEFALSVIAEDEPVFTSFVGIGDRKQVQSLMDGFGFFLGLNKKGDLYDMDGAKLMFNDAGLLYAGTDDLMSKMKAKKMLKLRDMGGFKFGSSPMSMFIDFKALLNMKDAEEFADLIKAFDYMYFQMNEKGGNGVIRSTKSNQNILRTLVESAIEMQRLDEIRQAEQDAMYKDWDEEDWVDEEWEELPFVHFEF